MCVFACVQCHSTTSDLVTALCASVRKTSSQLLGSLKHAALNLLLFMVHCHLVSNLSSHELICFTIYVPSYLMSVSYKILPNSIFISLGVVKNTNMVSWVAPQSFQANILNKISKII